MSKENTTIKYEGTLPLGNDSIPCYVLQDGTRILSGRGLQEALKVRDKPLKGGKRGGYILPTFFESKLFKDLKYNNLDVAKFTPIICMRGNQVIHGYEATVLADICDIILEARNKKYPLTERQRIVADQCEILMRAFAKVGIIALVDEATGYQYDREKTELQVILKAFISDEILEWQRTFQLSFYREIFRLWNIPFTPQNIKRKPQFIGILTNKLIYENLPKGTVVLEKLKEKTPKTKGGHYRYNLHRSLTKEVGREALIKVLYSVEALASISENKKQFLKLVEDKYKNDKYGRQGILFPTVKEIDKIAEDEPIEKPATPITDFDSRLKGLLAVPPLKKSSKN